MKKLDVAREDKSLCQAGKRLAAKADRLLNEGKIDRITYRDARWHALQMMRPRSYVRLVGF